MPWLEIVPSHYSDLKREPEASIRRIAQFLDFDVPDESWPAILDPGAMIRQGTLGASAEDGITPQISETIAGIGRTILTDPIAFDWCYHGGAVPAR